MTVPGLWLVLKTEKVESHEHRCSFPGKERGGLCFYTYRCGKKAHLKYVNIQQNLFLFTHASSPASTGGIICPRFWVGRNCTQCCFRAFMLRFAPSRINVVDVVMKAAVRLAASHEVMIQKSGGSHVFFSYTRETGNYILFFAFLLAQLFLNSSALLSSLTASSFFINKTRFLSWSSQVSELIAGFKMLQVSAWITRRQKTSPISWLFTGGLISNPLSSKTH